jgi:ribonucleoside-diphosphate reductase alpha chain
VVEAAIKPRPRPTVTVGHTVRMNTGCGNLYVTINENDEGLPFELFNHMGKAGGCAASQNEAIGRLISYALRCGASLEPLIKQLKGISCHRPAWGEDGKISSCSDAIGKSPEKYRRRRRRAARASGPGPAVGRRSTGARSSAERHREAAIIAGSNGGHRHTTSPSRRAPARTGGGQLS